jgi:uncharacterized protein YqjF (DUF2071 family)
MIDRIAPSRRPDEKNVGTQKWRKLLFLHWAVPVEKMRAVVPAELELDLWEGEAFVGIIPFAMHEVRPRLIPRALGFDFLETNLRTYVLKDGVPGIYFFSLEAESRLAVAAARATFGLPYFHARMSMIEEDGVVDYQTDRGAARHHVRYRIGESVGPAEAGTLDHFLVERYHLFVVKNGKTRRAQVYHRPYPIQRAEVLAVEDTLCEAAGLPSVRGEPRFVHYAGGVDVEVFAPRAV